MGWGIGARRGVRGRLSASYRNNTAILRWLLCAELALAGGPALAGGALPTGGQYVAGQGTIAGSANALTVNQSTNHGIIDWQGFSIGAGNRVQFNNGSGATLNRVTGNNLSRIDGSLSATGSVYLINPQGVVIGPGGKVVTNGSFVASTRDVSDSAFMSGGAFSASGTSNGSVVNAGTITSANGDAILVGRTVKNTGTISAPNGTAVMAAGNEIVLQPVGGDSRIAVSGGTGDVTNTGTVKAAQAALASAGGNVYALVENNGGINATGTRTIDGHVWLTAGGTAQISGNVTATNADGSGGTMTARAQNISVGGTVDASATAAGKSGGTVSIIAAGDTTVSGTVKAKGKAGGSGGIIETSGHTLEIGGATVDAGEGGQWLLDPFDLTVDASAASTIDSSLGAGTDVTLQTTASGTSGPGTANASGNGDILIESALSWNSAATLTLDAYRSIGIDADITVAGGGGVVLKTNDGGTGGDYGFGTGGSLSFTGGSGSGASLQINGASYTLLYSMGDVQNVDASDSVLRDNYALATSLDASATSGWIPIGTDGYGDIADFPNGFSGVFEGLGHTISNLAVSNLRLNHIDSNYYYYNYAGLFGASSGTIRDIGVVGGSVTGGGGVGGLVGYNSGTISNAYSTATVTAIASSTVGTSGTNDGGLVGWNVGTIHDVYAGGSVTGNGLYIGGLVGTNGGTITDAYSTGAVSGSSNVGGLAGYNGGTVTDSYWDTDTSGQPSSAAGSGLTTVQLTGSMPAGFSPSMWGNADNHSTPYLLALTSSSQPGYTGDGSNGVVQLLFTLGQLQDINDSLNGNYALANSLDASGVNWTPIGSSSAPFTGVFDGLDHTVSNLTINTTATEAGLFGFSSGTISNIGVAGGSINGRNEVGALLGENYGGTVSHAWASASVSSSTDMADVGGLVGYNDATITNSFATGSVTATGEDANVGGLVGMDFVGTISRSYATGAVTGGAGSYAGGLVGLGYFANLVDNYAMGSVTAAGVNSGGSGPVAGGLVGYAAVTTVDQSFATGVVTVSGANSAAGGLVGTNGSSTITNSYWDTDTSGLSTSAGGTGRTTAQLQAALPSGFDSSIWGTGAGLYPYFLWQYPTAPQAVSGKAYNDSGVTPLQGATVTALVNGINLGSVATGANGYYYFLEPSGTISSGSAVLAYTSGGARVDALNGSTSGFDIWENTLIAPTSATTYSNASATSLQTQDAALIAQAVGSNIDPTAELANYGYIASGDFAIDQPLILSNGLYLKSAGDITVADALTLQGANGLTLNASGALKVNATVSVTGAGNVSLNAGTDTATIPGISLVDLSFAPGASIDYGSTDNGGALSINGAAYTLIYTMSGLQNINNALSSNYALATSLDATGFSGWIPLGLNSAGSVQNSGNGFNGTFDGLGHTVSNLSITFNHLYAGLFGWVHGKIRNVGLVGGSVTSSSQMAGGLVGELYNGVLYNAYSSANVSASATAGGLIGLNSGYVARTYATGTVQASGNYAGGLAGQNSNQIVDSYATGSVSAGTGKAGGLVGMNTTGFITNAYATGTVTGSDQVGGLVGRNNGTGNNITNVYSTGYVTSSGANVGGLVGFNNGTVTNGYWDTQASGQSTSHGGTGLTTAELQGAVPSGFDGSIWGTGAGLYSYFLWQYPTTPQAVSGIAYSNGGGTPLKGGTVTTLVDGASLGSVKTGANGYYYFLEPSGTISSGAAVIAATSTGARLDTSDDALDASGNISGFDIWGLTLIAPTGATTYSDANATSLQTQDAVLLAQAIGSNTDPTAGLTHYGYIASGDFTIDATADLSNGLYVKSAGDITVADALTLPGANGLTLDAAGGLAIDAPITVPGAGRVALGAEFAPIFCGCTSVLNLSFGTGGIVDFGSVNNGAQLVINGDSYTLLYSMADVAGINSDSGLQGNYALATSFDASGTSGWIALGTDGAGNLLNSGDGFSGTFEGLGNTIANLTVDSGSNGGGLFGLIGASGTVRDMNLVDAAINDAEFAGILSGENDGNILSVTVSGTVDGTSNGYKVGGLVANNEGLIVNAGAAVTVTGGAGSDVGGLAGYNPGEILSSYATGDVSGQDLAAVGGLVGFNDNGFISQSHATGNATGGDGATVGGLVGYNDAGDIEQSYAAGDVNESGADSGVAYAGGLVGYNASGLVAQSYATGNVSGSYDVGGLVGFNSNGFVYQSFAIGSVAGLGEDTWVGGLVGENSGGIAQSFATGSVVGDVGNAAGGLVGGNDHGGVIDQTYAMGAVRVGATDPSSGTRASAGGLVGYNDGQIHESYSTGMVSGSDPSAAAGGLVGWNDTNGVVSDAYWDTETSGLAAGIGEDDGVGTSATGLVTADLQNDDTLTGFDFAATWGTGDGLYPYFLWQYPTAPQAISGTVYTDINGTTPLTGATVEAVSGGQLIGTGASGANGYYYVLPLPGGVNSAGILTYLAGNAVKGAMFTDDVADALDPASRQSGIDDIYGGTTLISTTDSNLSTALGNLVTTLGTVSNGDLGLIATTSSLEADAGGLAIKARSSDFTVDGTLTASGEIVVTAPDRLTLASGANLSSADPGNAIQIHAGTFINDAGSSPLTLTGGGRWLIYSDDPANDVFGGLDSGNTAIWNAASLSPDNVTQSGNRYLFAIRPTLTITTTDVTKTYGEDATANAAAAYTVSGYATGVAGAFLGDDAASVYSGAPSVTSSGSLGTASVGASPYAIIASLGGMALLNGYAVNFVDTGTLAVNKAVLTVTANNDSKTYDGLAYSGGNGVSYSGLVNGEDGSVLSGALIYGGTAQGAVNAGSYTITASGLTSGNYEIIYDPGMLTVNKASLTVTANSDSKTYDGLAYSGGNGVSYVGFVNGEDISALSGTLTYGGAAQGAINAGSYAITASGLTSGNYAITYDSGALTVNARPITVTADDLSRIYGAANPVLTYTVGGEGLVNGDTLSGSLDTAATAASNVGAYTIVQGSLVASANYALSFVPGTLTIDPAPLSITANNVTAATLSAAQFSATYAGFVNEDNSSVVSGLTYGVFPVTGDALDYDIVPFGATAANYTITFFPGLLTLSPQLPGAFPAPLIGDGGYNGSSSFALTVGANRFTFSNVATAALGAGEEVLLFEAGLPGTISPFQAVAVSDYSNATNSEDRLANCQSGGRNGEGTCGAGGGTGL